MGNSNSQNSPRPGLEGSYHLPPYSIFCACPWGPHPNGILSRDSQVGVSKLSKLGLSILWGPITLCADLELRLCLKQSCSPLQNIFNGMWHATYTQGNQVESRFLVVGSQTINSTFGLSFGHNLCFKCPNGSCKPILDIYVSIFFQRYKELLNPLGFDPCNRSLNIQESTGTPTPNVGVPLGVWRCEGLFLHTLLHSRREQVARLQGFFLGSQPCNPLALVASPRLGLWHKWWCKWLCWCKWWCRRQVMMVSMTMGVSMLNNGLIITPNLQLTLLFIIIFVFSWPFYFLLIFTPFQHFFPHSLCLLQNKMRKLSKQSN